ncbi:MAG: glycosyltransferase [Candidatus Thermoplasmatota archaeon]|nr:glycosyltransferase [Candidatus Thermoplasmatota archaeon]
MLISVVVTVRNEEKRIGDLLDSLVVQDGSFEIVITDAYSDDRTRDIIKEYAERYDAIHLYMKGGTRGVGRNYAVKKAEGEVVAFVDGDCIANPFWLKEIRRSLEDTGAEVVAGKSITLGYAPFAELDRVELTKSGFDVTFPSCNLAYSRELFRSIRGFDPQFMTAEDIDLNFRAVSVGSTIVYNENAIIYAMARDTFMGFFKQAFWNGFGRKQLTLKHGNLWDRYSFREMIGEHINTWYFIRMMFGMIGYMVCKVHDKPEMFRMSDLEMMKELREERAPADPDAGPQTS